MTLDELKAATATAWIDYKAAKDVADSKGQEWSKLNTQLERIEAKEALRAEVLAELVKEQAAA